MQQGLLIICSVLTLCCENWANVIVKYYNSSPSLALNQHRAKLMPPPYNTKKIKILGSSSSESTWLTMLDASFLSIFLVGVIRLFQQKKQGSGSLFPDPGVNSQSRVWDKVASWRELFGAAGRGSWPRHLQWALYLFIRLPDFPFPEHFPVNSLRNNLLAEFTVSWLSVQSK